MTEGTPPRRRMTRLRRSPNVAGGRTIRHEVWVSSDEERRLLARSEALGITVPRLLLESALAGSKEASTERRDAMVELFAVRRLLAAVSNNVNQIARHANSGDEFPRDAAGALLAVRRVVARIDVSIEGLARP